jgi:hypothetical protein
LKTSICQQPVTTIMNSISFKQILVLSCLVLLLSCSKSDSGSPVNGASGKVEIYLLNKVEWVPGKCEVNGARSIPDALPVITNNDIIAYYSSVYEFEVNSDAFKRIIGLSDKTPFVVTLNKEVIYYGIYKPFISSSSCDHSITMSTLNYNINEFRLQMRLGYPGLLQGVTVEDLRNHNNLLSALEKQGKLK